ncbi:NAD(P)H-binding protein [Planosporangium mesophilum]|uniref:NAD(P)H-binding protein n=1 Tax=Planosporangium mesophilum TaxID=689768 RepID=UPI0019527A08|nr:NAD(P)H-binding protein [Planosporangium mesophilum]
MTGATGHVGGELIAQLAAAQQPVRAMTRRPEVMQAPPGVEVVYGDCDDEASLDAAFDGADRAFLMSAQVPCSAKRPTHDLRLVRAARQAGIRHVVKLSVYDGGSVDDALGAWHRQAEAAVTGSGLDWTLLRPGRFMSNALQWAPAIRRSDTVHIPFAHRPAAPIDPADIAAIAVAALTTDGHDNMVYQLSGPEIRTPTEELRILAETLGRPLRLVEPTIDQAKTGMLRAGMTHAVVEAIVARVLAGGDGAEVLATVERVLGRPPRTFADWTRNHAGAFLAAD